MAVARRVLVCGGRDYIDVCRVYNELERVHLETPISVVIAGGARGVDTYAVEWAETNGLVCHVYYADWDRHGKGAGCIRNQQMLDGGKPNLVVAFPGGRGTADMVRRARKAGVLVIEVA